MKTISLIGYKGFVGSKISEELSKNTNYNLVNLKRGDTVAMNQYAASGGGGIYGGEYVWGAFQVTRINK